MSEALAQTISYVNRARAFMPPGTVSPFVIRYDAGTLPVGYMVFSSPSRTLSYVHAWLPPHPRVRAGGHAVRSASVGDRRAARVAGYRPAMAPMARA